MHTRYLRVTMLSSAGLAAGMLLLLAHLAMPAPGVMAASAAPASGTIPMQTVLTATKDNTIYDTLPLASNGAGEYLFVGNNSSPGTSRRALLAFDIAGSVPPSSTILSVTLQLQMSRSNAGATDVALHPLLADWGEGTSNAAGNEGGGATPSTGDATWQHTFFDAQFWQNEGGDFSASASATTGVAGPGLYRWGPTTGMVNDVQGWLDDPASNFGWILVGDEGTNRTTKRFGARENSSPIARPQLTIVFTTPGQTTQALYLPLIQKP
jgi:hypothetical protein